MNECTEIIIITAECWRLSKYYPGDVFQTHCDSNFARTAKDKSFFTVNIYLNAEFSRGRTRFYDDDEDGNELLSVQPEAGLALIFAQPPYRFYPHDGEVVEGGLKYLLRSDVMYRKING